MFFSPPNTAPEPRKANPVAKRVDDDACVDGASPKIHKVREPTKDSSVSELKDRTQNSPCQGGVRMGQRKFVEMMNVGNSEVQRCQKDDLVRGDLGQQVKRYKDRPKDDLLSDGTSHVVPITLPAA